MPLDPAPGHADLPVPASGLGHSRIGWGEPQLCLQSHDRPGLSQQCSG